MVSQEASKEETMQSSNPVFSRNDAFNGKGGTAYADFGGTPVTHDTDAGPTKDVEIP